MAIITITKAHLDAHAEHRNVNPRCPLCARWGTTPTDSAYAGRILTVNPPQIANPADW